MKTNQKHLHFQWGLGIDQIWLWGVLACLFFVVSPMSVSPNDFWWHLKIGEIIYNTKTIPTTNMFGWTLPADQPFFYGEWLGELLFYTLYKINGLSLIIFFRNILVVAAFGLLGYETHRKSGSWRLAGIAMVLAAVMGSNNLGVRPQIWAWVPFMSMYILYSRYADGKLHWRWLLLGLPIMAFWVNTHGSYVLGLVLAGIFFMGEAARSLLKWDGSLPLSKIPWLGAGVVAAFGGTLINPRFWGVYGYVLKMMTDRPSQSLVVEWQSPAPNSYATVFFFASILFLIVLLAYTHFRPTPTQMLLVIAFTWLAWSGIRYVIWYGLVIMPLLAQILQDFTKSLGYRYRQILRASPSKSVVNLAIVVILFIPAVFVQPWFIDQIPMPDSFWQTVLHDNGEGPLLSTGNPVEAVEYIKQHPGGKIFNEMGYGSYLIWALPEQKVFCDTRVELYPYEFWLDYIKISNGVRYNELFDKYGVERLVIDRKEQEGLIESLVNDPTWKIEYQDKYTEIWSRVN